MTSNPERLRRPKPARTAPIRSFSELLDERPPGQRPSTRAEEPAAPEASPEDVPEEAAGDTSIRGAVDLGYRVIDDYLRQGRRFAEDVAGNALGRAEGDAEGGSDIRTIADRLSRDWLLLVTRVVDTLGGMGANVADDTSAHRRPSPGVSPTAMTVEVAAPGPTRVTLELNDGATPGRLRVQALRSIDGERPDIADVSVEPSDDAGRVIVQVRMSDDQPPGTYAGVIYDLASEHPCGTLSVRLGSD